MDQQNQRASTQHNEVPEVLHLLWGYCRARIHRTGRGAPELGVWVTTLISIQSSRQPGLSSPEEVVCGRLQDDQAFALRQLAKVDSAWCPKASAQEYQRKLAAIQDLLHRLMDTRDWTVPDLCIPPVLYLWCIQPGNTWQQEAFQRHGYQATACDLRPSHLASWSQEVIQGAHLAAYRNMSDARSVEEAFQRIVETARNNHRPFPTYLLYNQRNQTAVYELLDRLRIAGYELVLME